MLNESRQIPTWQPKCKGGAKGFSLACPWLVETSKIPTNQMVAAEARMQNGASLLKSDNSE